MLNAENTIEQVVGWNVDKGERRGNMEDTVATMDFEFLDGDIARTVSIYAVADGMGGHKKGEVASRMAVQTVIEQLVKAFMGDVTGKDYEQIITSAVENANHTVYEQEGDMGTTLVMAVVIENKAYIANVGDSRAYLICDNGINQITQDQSFVQELLNIGAITPEQAENHPRKNILSQAIGAKEEVQVDMYTMNFAPGNYLMLCSDGLTNELDNDTIHKIVVDSGSPQVACDELVIAANDNGGRDNISVVLIEQKLTNSVEILH